MTCRMWFHSLSITWGVYSFPNFSVCGSFWTQIPQKSYEDYRGLNTDWGNAWIVKTWKNKHIFFSFWFWCLLLSLVASFLYVESWISILHTARGLLKHLIFQKLYQGSAFSCRHIGDKREAFQKISEWYLPSVESCISMLRCVKNINVGFWICLVFSILAFLPFLTFHLLSWSSGVQKQ
jgi:hypothetical protein